MNSQNVRKGLFPLSADPITYGHLDIIARARDACDALIVLVCENEQKLGSYTFTREERVALTRRAVEHVGLSDVRVLSSGGLLVDVMQREHITHLFRGIRNDRDRAMEQEQLQLHALLRPSILTEAIFLEASPNVRHVSSSLVKAFVRQGVDVSSLVPVFVKSELEQRLRRTVLVGLTGTIASGKTSVGTALVEAWHKAGTPASLLNIDQLQRQALDEQTPAGEAVRQQLAALFSHDILLNEGRTINRRSLAAHVFSPTTTDEQRTQAHAIVRPSIERLLRHHLQTHEGIILLEWAQLVEMGLSHWVNHRVVIVDSPDQKTFAQARGVTEEMLRRICSRQWSAEEKRKRLEACIQADQAGWILHFVNHACSSGTPDVSNVREEIERLLPVWTIKRQEDAACYR